MKREGTGKRLTIYINEDSQYDGHSLYHALVLKLKECGAAGVTVSRGMESFGKHKHLHTTRILELSLQLPVVIDVIDSHENILRYLPEIKPMIQSGLMTLSDVEILFYGE